MIDPTIQEWLYAREMMRRLGFQAEDLFFDVYPSGKTQDLTTGAIVDLGGPVIGLLLRQGNLTFKWTIGVTRLPVGEIQAAYEAACEAWNDRNTETDIDAFRASKSMARATELLIALKAKGFQLEKG